MNRQDRHEPDQEPEVISVLLCLLVCSLSLQHRVLLVAHDLVVEPAVEAEVEVQVEDDLVERSAMAVATGWQSEGVQTCQMRCNADYKSKNSLFTAAATLGAARTELSKTKAGRKGCRPMPSMCAAPAGMMMEEDGLESSADGMSTDVEIAKDVVSSEQVLRMCKRAKSRFGKY